jgi:hypothetical protein
MVTLGRRGADVLAVGLAVAGITLLSALWAATAGNDAPAPADGKDLASAQVTPGAAAGREKRERSAPAFAEDFEGGLGQWREVGSTVITGATAAEGRRSATFTATACRGDAYSRRLPVEAGSVYRLSADYRTEGDGGYLGLALYDAAGDEVGEQWLMGDGAFPTYENVRWRYNIDSRDPDDLASWGRYTTRYVIPRRVDSVSIKLEDWGCGGLPDHPRTTPVYFDRIIWTSAPEGRRSGSDQG